MHKYLEKRSVRIAGHRTSIALEREFWEQLEASAKRANQTIPTWLAAVEEMRQTAHPDQSLASACRVQILAEVLALGRTR